MINKLFKKTAINILILTISLIWNLQSFTLPVQAGDLNFTNIAVQDVDNNKLTIVWSTNMPTQTWLKIESKKTNWQQTIGNTSYATNQQTTISLPEENTTYHYRIIAEARDGQRTTSFKFNFKSGKFVDDKILKFTKTPKLLYVDDSTAIIIWQINKKGKTNLKYSKNFDLKNSKSAHIIGNDSHTAKATLKNLHANTTYYYKVKIFDYNNKISSAILKFTTRNEKDPENLRLLNRQPLDNNSKDIKDSSVTFTWQTNRPAVCELRYGLISKGKQRIKESGWGSIRHKFEVKGLLPGNEYVYQVNCLGVLNSKLKTEDIKFKTKTPLVLGYELNPGLKQSFGGETYRLVKAADSSRIYALIKKQKYLIKNPEIFTDYNFNQSNIEIISTRELNRYPDAKLIKTANNPAVYFIYRRLNRKKSLLSETAFLSYRANSWQKIVTISERDLASYRDIVLVKEKNKNTVYLLQGNKKRPIKDMNALKRNNLDGQPIGVVNQKDLNSYLTGHILE